MPSVITAVNLDISNQIASIRVVAKKVKHPPGGERKEKRPTHQQMLQPLQAPKKRKLTHSGAPQIMWIPSRAKEADQMK